MMKAVVDLDEDDEENVVEEDADDVGSPSDGAVGDGGEVGCEGVHKGCGAEKDWGYELL